MPLTISHDGSKLLIPVSVDGTVLRMILDTGSESLEITEAAARRASQEVAIGTHIAGTDETGLRAVEGIGGSRIVHTMQVSNLGIGRMHGSFLADVSDQTFVIDGKPTDGLLGMSVLHNFDFDLDVAGRALRLYSANGLCTTPAVALDQPIYALPIEVGYRGDVREIVRVTINGQTFRALLDTGSPGNLLFGNTTAALGLAANTTPGRHIKIEGVGGVRSVVLTRLDAVSVGPLTLRHVPVVADTESNPEADMLLGLDFMRRVHVWFSNSSHTLVMQYPPAPAPQVRAGGD